MKKPPDFSIGPPPLTGEKRTDVSAPMYALAPRGAKAKEKARKVMTEVKQMMERKPMSGAPMGRLARTKTTASATRNMACPEMVPIPKTHSTGGK
jgi:formylglycine-generating enzyme required for sulfatase activity